MRFWLGTHETAWLERTDVDLFIAHPRLAKRKRGLPRALGEWACDSGGFTQLRDYGRWTFSTDSYAEAVERYRSEIGGLVWAAPMDWMCEPQVITGGVVGKIRFVGTGLSVREHQERTVQSYLDLRDRGPFVPVPQGWEMDDYWRCVDLYTSAGVDVRDAPVVGIGSVCRRQGTREAERLIVELATYGIALHGFGFKRNGLDRVAWALHSADSLAWSYNARRNPAMAGCTHKNCNSCIRWALRWRGEVVDKIGQPQQAALGFGR